MTERHDPIPCRCGAVAKLEHMQILTPDYVGAFWVECECGRKGSTAILASDAIWHWEHMKED